MQIKHLIQGLLSNIVVAYLSFEMLAIAFRTNIYCYVRGYVYSEGKDLSLTRSDGCATIKHGTTSSQVLMHDDVFWVLVNVPRDVKGHTSFWYKWGSNQFYINGNPHDIDWGYVLRG